MSDITGSSQSEPGQSGPSLGEVLQESTQRLETDLANDVPPQQALENSRPANFLPESQG
ncbi:hypothetical protein [Actinomadura verrucosospora]|uniref:Uncharacterized protein n=1 Tax=Actinomadura verrucosospora TaxID=46165 RepID=A0A7D3ZGX7_ACTVE|nr:hypothetical protein [Actinomadura verrucosospora]QKG23277.1 hypothetical protein ACTIVE_4920 [Actinomadura verrucosospora]